MSDMVYVNGEFVPRESAMVSVEDRGYQFADGVYEVVRFHGRRGLRLDAHLQRLVCSGDALRIKGAPSVDRWHEILKRLMDECQIPHDEENVTTLYQQVSRGVSPRNHLFPRTACPPGVVAYFRSAPQYTFAQRTNGISLSTQKDERWERCYIKSICLLPVVLAKQSAAEAGAMEALLVRNNIVTEGGATNAYCVRKGILYTHPEGPYILSGVTRGLVMEAAAQTGVEVREVTVTLDEFRAAEEAFISSTTMDLMPATSLDQLPIGDGKVGPITRTLMGGVANIIQSELNQVVPES